MKISKIKIQGFRSFGLEETVISTTKDLTAFIGHNSSGKTAALEALRKLFGSTIAERELRKQDFHISKDEDPNSITERTLKIEVHLSFSETDKSSIAHFFSHMVIEEKDSDPYLRLRLEAIWTKSNMIQDGEIESNLFFIKVSEGEVEADDSKQLYPNHLRSLIQILYVPAIRKPSEQIKFASGTILYRVLKRIKWEDEFKEDFESKIEDINNAFRGLPEFKVIQASITSFWEKFHKDERYKETNLGFGGSDFDSILKKLEVSFSPTPTNRSFSIDDLGEGYRSLFYFTLVCALLDVEDKLDDDEDSIGINRPLLTILAIEEPENHIAPQLLGRIIKILLTIASKENSQVLLSSHTPAIIKRLEPTSISHFRITKEYITEVNQIVLPPESDLAYKYVKEAIHNYPEIYFAKLVVIGEGDSEEVIFNRLMQVMDIDFDDNVISFAPLGHRFVNHIWKLLNTLHIPYITILDLDVERNGAGWGRVKYAISQLILNGADKKKLLAIEGGILSDEDFEKMHKWSLKNNNDIAEIKNWIVALQPYNVFFSYPLDLDFLMLKHYPEFYKGTAPKGGGPRIPDKIEDNAEYLEKLNLSIQSTLKSEKATGDTYSEDDKELMIWYNYLFLGRGKPTTHIQSLSSMEDKDVRDNLPNVFKAIFKRIAKLIS